MLLTIFKREVSLIKQNERNVFKQKQFEIFKKLPLINN